MIYIWRGWGFVVPLIWFVTLWIVQLTTNGIFGWGTYERWSIFKLAGTVGAAIAIWIIGNMLNENIESNSNKHSFFFIPIEYWGYIIPAITILWWLI